MSQCGRFAKLVGYVRSIVKLSFRVSVSFNPTDLNDSSGTSVAHAGWVCWTPPFRHTLRLST